MSTRTTKTVGVAAGLAALVLSLAACGDPGAAAAPVADANGKATVVVADNTRTATRTEISVQTQAAIRAELPAAVRDRGTLVIGVGALPAGFPPLAYVGDDHKTLTGAEPDLGRLVAATLGLKPDVQNNAWENMFVRLSSGQLDAGFSNITVTEERKQKYDFASYRDDNLAFAVKKDSTWNFTGDYHALAGLTVAVSSGTNQEKLLLEWKKKLEAEGKTLEIKYYKDNNGIYLALAAGRIDAYFGPNPGIGRDDHPDADRGHLLRCRGDAPGPDRGDHQEGQRAGQAAGGLDQLPDQGRPVRGLAQGLQPGERGRQEVRGQPGRAAARQRLTRGRRAAWAVRAAVRTRGYNSPVIR
jgi:polar amino acid transport system substrate-binding protein